MAEFLIHLGRGDPDDPRDFQPGDIIKARRDGATWNRGVSRSAWIEQGNAASDWPGQGIFVILKIPGLTRAKARRAVQAEVETFIDDDGEEAQRVIKKRLWRLRLDEIPVAIKQAALADGEVTVTLDQVKAFIRHKLDGRTVDQA